MTIGNDLLVQKASIEDLQKEIDRRKAIEASAPKVPHRFDPQNLSVLAYANNFTLWRYTTKAKIVTDENYFHKGVDMLRVGDLMIINYDTDGDAKAGFFIVSKSDGRNVAIAPYA